MNIVNLKGAYAKINLDNIVHNYKEACKQVGDDVTVTCVVKSDAYGHGEVEVVKALMENGLNIFCVSTVIEGIRLREQFPAIDILILGYTPKFLSSKAVAYNLIQTISSMEEAIALHEAGKARVHIKVNSGMNRLGFNVDEADLIRQVSELRNIEICGIFTHLHSSDSGDKTTAKDQFYKYKTLLNVLDHKGVRYGTRHVCNSGGIIDLKEMHMDMVREGIMLYGMYPSKEVNHDEVKLKECMEYFSYVAGIHVIQAGEGVSYGHTFIAEKDMKVATINIGYSDGVFRHLSNKGDVIIRDTRCPIVGRVCMNMIMVDVSHLHHVEMEDRVILFGASENQFISIDEVADNVGTISYEITCRTGYSVPRVYEKNNEIVKVEQELLIEKAGVPVELY